MAAPIKQPQTTKHKSNSQEFSNLPKETRCVPENSAPKTIYNTIPSDSYVT